MKYRASNGITSAILTEAEAREHFDNADRVFGDFGETFVTVPVGAFGRLLTIAATRYTPIGEQPVEDWPQWTPGAAADDQQKRRGAPDVAAEGDE